MSFDRAALYRPLSSADLLTDFSAEIADATKFPRSQKRPRERGRSSRIVAQRATLCSKSVSHRRKCGPLRSSQANPDCMKIEEVIRTINQMKADGVLTNYALGGAVGATFYLEPVATLDVDVFIEH